MLIQCKSLTCTIPPLPTFQIKVKLGMLDGIGTRSKIHIHIYMKIGPFYTGQVTTS